MESRLGKNLNISMFDLNDSNQSIFTYHCMKGQLPSLKTDKLEKHLREVLISILYNKLFPPLIN